MQEQLDIIVKSSLLSSSYFNHLLFNCFVCSDSEFQIPANSTLHIALARNAPPLFFTLATFSTRSYSQVILLFCTRTCLEYLV